ncbi:ABC transporter substrate-binding protein [Methylomarinum vadi]|uniref:ABC transporter substrate-binding protein n=1 Tax=Methylomarinum vadi TaxID=438855 RepID=UPI001F407439|nr:ABC transporter substrate-binding protein [Methylomarinum vadi]
MLIYLIWLVLVLFVWKPGIVYPADDSQPQTVDLQLRWHHQFQFAGYYAALEKGFYRAEGLEVRLHQARPGLNPNIS